MATSSSNKMPLLVDRPLHAWASIGGTAALTSATNANTPSGAGLQLLVDCSGNDGAVVDSASVVITEANTTTSRVLLFLSVASNTASVSATNTALVASVSIPGSSTLGQRVNVALPPLSIPVPNLASPAATMATYPTETDKKNTGLYVPSGALLYAGVDAVLSAPSSSTRVLVFAQGGFF
jgi:hypothetical protein